MFGISWAEFLVILIVAILVVPVKYWPEVARFLARVIKYIRKIIWQITDATDKIKDQIDLEKPINDIINTTTNDMLNDFSTPIKKTRGRKKTAKK
ncbi:MAG: twin-arginine translocase TatA/TatE family subunit [Alphaproteobacteria bacterium]|nr:twin-arginine translocase TatA/TatE family subunit [Alphaproteobacteria bacterium]MBR6837981.1 twin-arginine translocase TatA/TatE family subunit [Alphaproteobacteria bacterium]